MPPDDVRSLEETFASRDDFHAKAAAVLLPAPDIVPSDHLNKAFRRALLRQDGGDHHSRGTSVQIKTAILKRAAQRGVFTRLDQIVITRSAMESFNICLDSLSRADSPVLVESPSFYPTIESLRHRRIKAIEIYSHPQFGIDPQQFEHILKSTGVKLCIVTGANRMPTGVTYDRATLETLVRVAEENGATIIENDMFGDLSYSALNIPSLKEFDKHGTVVQFGGTGSFLASSYEIGWILAGTHAPKVSATRHLGGTNMPHVALQATLSEYLLSPLVERHLRQTTRLLSERMSQGLELLKTHFPKQITVAAPSGGFVCWVRGPRRFDATKLAMRADNETFDFVPGQLFSTAGGFANFIALNFSAEWSLTRKRKLRRLGEQIASAES
jgi:DNA-binding transcriptional MocR family regulator